MKTQAIVRALSLSFLLALLAANASDAQTKRAIPATATTWTMTGKWPPPITSPILITVEIVEVHPGVIDKFERSLPNGADKYANMLDELLQSQVNEAIVISVQTRNDVMGVASYDKVVGFSTRDKAKPGRNFVTLGTSLSATPHLEENHTITVTLKATTTRLSPHSTSNTIGRGITLPHEYLLNGLTHMYGGLPLDHKGQPAKAHDPQTLEEVFFVTATVLPVEAATQ